MTTPLPKRYGKTLPLIINPDERICFTIQVPDILEYRAAIYGVIGELGEWFTWQHYQTDYVNPPTRNKEAAELWVQLLADAVWEECMSFCEQMIGCLTTDTDVQAALASQMLTNELIRNAINQVAGKGAPMLPGTLTLPIATGCDKDELFAQVTGIIDTMNQNNVDFLEILAAATAPARKLAAAIAAIPVIETLPIDDAIDWVAKMQAEIVVNYNAEWTTSVRDTLRCELFCIAQEHTDCVLTYDDIKKYFNDRLGAALDPAHLLAAVVQYTVAGTWAGTTVVDIMMLNQISIWQVAGDWMGVNLRTLQAVTKISSNYPDSDWSTLCDPCAPVGNCFEFSVSEQDWTGYADTGAQYTEGQGWGQNANTYLVLLAPLGNDTEVQSLGLKFTRAWSGVNDFDKFFITISNSDGSNAQSYGTGFAPLLQGNDFTFVKDGSPWIRPRVQMAAGGYTFPPNSSNPSVQYVDQICFNPEV